MSWHYSQEPEEGFSLQTYLDGLQSRRLKSSSTQETYCCKDKETGTLSSSPSGTMSEPSTEDPGEDLSMSSAEGSPAKTSQSLTVKVEDLPEIAQAFGLSISESLTRLDLSLSSRKTVRTYVPKDSVQSSKGLPAWGMTLDGECWELGTSVRTTSETGCGYWPSPTAQEAGEGPFLGGLQTKTGEPAKRGERAYNPKTGKHVQITLNRAVKMWPKPTRRDYKGTNAPEGLTRKDGKSRLDQLPNAVKYSEDTPTPGGHLNPDWVEWLMGWPIGWTALKPLETDKYQQWLQQHSEYCHKDFCIE